MRDVAMNKAIITEIKRFAVHDGEGIRTTVFFKGCPLKCVWCHNPEGISPKIQLAHYKNNCIGCGECAAVCTSGAWQMTDGKACIDRDKCTLCGACEAACLGDAIKIYGKAMSVDELLPILLEDRAFYETSGGGVTLSGGECLCQAEFAAELLKRLKDEGINTAVDTCGYVSRESIDKVLSYTDTFLYDIKAIDGDVHEKCTGQKNGLILDNLEYIYSLGKDIEVRMPHVPGFNGDQTAKIGEFLKGFPDIKGVKILPYHNYAASKYAALDMENTLPDALPTNEEIENAERIIAEASHVSRDDIKKAIERIERMEKCFDTLLCGAAQNPPVIEEELLALLTDYYENGQWLRDWELDERGYLPRELKRGVLSEDGVYNFLAGLDGEEGD